MKKLFAILMIAAMLLASLTGCSTKAKGAEGEESTKDSDDKIKIGIVQPVEHPSLNQIREYIIIGLEEQGLKDKVEITYNDAQGDQSNINTIVSQFVGDEMDIIVPIATAPAQSAAAATKDIPIVFAAVSYPVDAGLVKDVNITDENITGVSDAIDIKEIFELALTLTPDIKTFGFIYNTGEINSVSSIEEAKKYCDKNGLNYVESTITNSSELLQGAQSLIGKVDAIFTPTDNTVASAMPILSAEAMNANIPVYTGADSLVADGGFATVGVDYKVLGRQVSEMIKRIIDGEKISNIPVETLNEYTKIINISTAKEIGVEISEELIKEFHIIE
ncbi:ABC transporter substrate-binding protein [Sedimentibacter sp. MB31-C6]|uniref:ABC transporter substrate-binding protein n=1 Tax=Sedimentibacter sp. MB31-C6 TaxID=3109366 RepID=UPI002DDD8F8B|nr:ABC transporter substrate-binding protein [Sedimentibacter sp. MB36-C1]WSI02987.1 ABC transporter substrate-binding protein [Sedimentibacter sp. MB36-C1]